jgi:hypothetical protein
MRTKLSTLLALFLAPMACASTWYVNGVNGNDTNDCTSPQTACKTIGHAISLASSGDSINATPATYRENLVIAKGVNVIVSGAGVTIVDGGRLGPVFSISKGAIITLSRMTIQNGFAIKGGGISNSGTVTLSNSTVSGNVASGGNGTIHQGGGLYNAPGGKMTIINSTISGNGAISSCKHAPCFIGGGGIYNAHTLTIHDSTISANSAPSGSAIYSIGGVATINNTTINGNVGSNVAVFGYLGSLTMSNTTVAGNSGGIFAENSSIVKTTVTLQNSIVANNGVNCAGGIASNGYNLSSDSSCNFNNAGDLNDTNPMLGPLQNNGGPTNTQALLFGSPAIDAGNPSGCTGGDGHLLTTDQRGKPRPDPEDTGGCDMGAYERQGD